MKPYRQLLINLLFISAFAWSAKYVGIATLKFGILPATVLMGIFFLLGFYVMVYGQFRLEKADIATSSLRMMSATLTAAWVKENRWETRYGVHVLAMILNLIAAFSIVSKTQYLTWTVLIALCILFCMIVRILLIQNHANLPRQGEGSFLRASAPALQPAILEQTAVATYVLRSIAFHSEPLAKTWIKELSLETVGLRQDRLPSSDDWQCAVNSEKRILFTQLISSSHEMRDALYTYLLAIDGDLIFISVEGNSASIISDAVSKKYPKYLLMQLADDAVEVIAYSKTRFEWR